MSRLQPRALTLLVSVAVAAVLAGFEILVYLPARNEAATLARLVALKHVEIARLEAEQTGPGMSGGAGVFRQVEPPRSLTAASLPARDVPDVLRRLAALADGAGVTVTSVAPAVSRAATGGAGGDHALAIEIDVHGTFASALRFLEGLEALDDMLMPSAVRLAAPPRSTADDNPQDPGLILTVTAKARTTREGGKAAVRRPSTASTSAVLTSPHRIEPHRAAAGVAGRANPFAAPESATAVQMSSGQKPSTQSPSAAPVLAARAPVSAATRHGEASFGIDLPLPPGFVGRGGSEPPAAPHAPGDEMKVGAIIGGSERVAIIDDHGTIVTVGVGDRVGDAVVARILGDRVILRRGTKTFELRFEGAAP